MDNKVLFVALVVIGVAALVLMLSAYIPFLFRGSSHGTDPLKDLDPLPAEERVALVEDPHTSAKLRLELIRNARESIIISYHTFSDGIYSSMFVSELMQAADRGVHITFMNDGMIGGLCSGSRKIAAIMNSHENFEMYFYEPWSLIPYRWNNRLHDKYLLVDGQYLLTGGRNISDKTFMPDGFRHDVVFDRDIFIIGEKDRGIMQSVAYYDSCLKASKCTRRMKVKDIPRERIDELIRLGNDNTEKHPELGGKVDSMKFFEVESIRLISNPIGRGSKEPIIWNEILRLARENPGRMIIQSPYIVPYNQQLRELHELDKEMVFITNSLRTTPNLPAFPHYLRNRYKIQNIAPIYEYALEGSVHSKSIMIGDDISIIGSFNFDPRSLHLDTETMYVIESREFKVHLENVTEQWKSASIIRVDDEKPVYPEGFTDNYSFLVIKDFLFRILSVILWPVMILV